MCKVRSIATREEQSTPPRLKQAPAMKTLEGENVLKMRKMRRRRMMKKRMRSRIMGRMGMRMMVRMVATLEMRVRGQKEGMTVVVSS